MDIDSSGSGGWRFAQCFGDKGEVEDITEGMSFSLSALIAHPPPRLADIISTVEFDSTGNYLATGDKGGRVVLFERNESVSSLPRYPSWLIPSDCHPTPSYTTSTYARAEKRLRIQVLYRISIT